MDIVHLSWEFPPVVYGGLGRHVHALAVAQARSGHRVSVVTQRPAGAPRLEMVEGVQVIRVRTDGPFPYHLPSLLTWVGGLDHAMGVAAAACTHADVVHAHDWVTARAGRVASQTLDIPLIATIHATEAGRHRGWLPDPVSRGVHLVEQWLVDEADEVIVCSRSMADEVRAAHAGDAENITVIPNGIDPAAYRRAEDIPAALMAGTPRLSLVGRIEWEKGVFTAVEAMPAIVAAHPDARLRIVGTGSQVDAVRQAVAADGLEDNIDLFGHVDEATLRAVYTSSDLVIAPSSYEPFGIVALEAAAMGAPLIVGDTGGLAEFVTDERGLRARPDDPGDLARAILAALDDPAATARRRDAATAALSGYTWPQIAQRTCAVYTRARRRPHPRRALAAPANPVW